MLYLISIILFFALIGLFLYKYRKKLEIKYYIFYALRTNRFKKTIDRIANMSPMFWKFISTIAIVLCLYYMLNGVMLFGELVYRISTGEIQESALQLILPTASASTEFGNGYILIPFWFWIIILVTILVPHELAHGIISRAEKIKLKSVGVFLLAIFPGAFVEPDEKQLMKAKPISKLRVFAAGSAANFLVAFLIILALNYLIWPSMTGTGIEILSVNQSSPAAIAGLTAGTIITHINDKPITSTYKEYGYGYYFFDEVGVLKPTDNITLSNNQDSYNVELTKLDNKTYMGITYRPVTKIDPNFFLTVLNPLLSYMYLFSFGVALFNILPIYPLDGGLMIETIGARLSKRYGKKIAKAISSIMLLVILYCFIAPHIL